MPRVWRGRGFAPGEFVLQPVTQCCHLRGVGKALAGAEPSKKSSIQVTCIAESI